MANEHEVKYVSNSEKSDEHFILLDVHQIEKRQVVAPSTTHMSDSAHLTASSTTKMPSSNPPTSKLPNSTPSSTTHMSHSAHVSTTKVPGLTTSSTANHDSVSRQQTTHQPQTTGTSLPVETTTPISYIKTFSSHKYYNLTILHDGTNGYWDELYNHTKHVYLSNDGHLISSGINITFTMPFYGHNISRLQLTTGGFIYMGPYVHRFLTHSQYAAPLMANFDTKANNSEVLYKEYENESIVVEWRNVQLNDANYHGQFTFQAKLFQNGTIMFAYKTVPVAIGSISTAKHSVKLGVSDAFYYDYTKNGVRYRRIYRYHSVDLNVTMIQANTVVILDPLPTCNTFTGCDQCVSANIDFECSWCPKISTCSNGGLDWNLQKWYNSRCNETAGNTSSICMLPTTAKPTTDKPTTTKPTTAKPTTTKPTTAKPTTTKPTTTKPTTANPTTTKPTTAKPTTDKPTTAKPTTDKPTTAKPTTAKPTTDEHTTAKPTTISTSTGKSTSTSIPTTTQKMSQIPKAEKQTVEKDSTNTAAIAVPVVLTLVIVGLVGGWMHYAFTHPNTASGQWLIEHRPSQLKARLAEKFKWSTETGDKYKINNEEIEIDFQESLA